MELDYESMCHGEISYGSSYRDYKATLDHFLRMHNTSLNSPFIDNVVSTAMIDRVDILQKGISLNAF